jgi:hypothetical protein
MQELINYISNIPRIYSNVLFICSWMQFWSVTVACEYHNFSYLDEFSYVYVMIQSCILKPFKRMSFNGLVRVYTFSVAK